MSYCASFHHFINFTRPSAVSPLHQALAFASSTRVARGTRNAPPSPSRHRHWANGKFTGSHCIKHAGLVSIPSWTSGREQSTEPSKDGQEVGQTTTDPGPTTSKQPNSLSTERPRAAHAVSHPKQWLPEAQIGSAVMLQFDFQGKSLIANLPLLLFLQVDVGWFFGLATECDGGRTLLFRQNGSEASSRPSSSVSSVLGALRSASRGRDAAA